jgi:hypothetical protein
MKKITKAKLKKIIKEELEVVLTNEEVEEMFGEDVREELEQTQEGFFAGEFDKKSPKKPKTNRPMDRSQKEKDKLDRFYHAVNKRMQEKKLTEPEKKEKEKVAKGMKKSKKDFKKRYGDDAESVMYATATKIAKDKK